LRQLNFPACSFWWELLFTSYQNISPVTLTVHAMQTAWIAVLLCYACRLHTLKWQVLKKSWKNYQETKDGKILFKERYIAPSSSKFNPKRRRKVINFQWLFHMFLGFWPKRHQLLMTFPCVFRFLSLETYKHKEKSSEVDVFSESSGLNFEDEGVIWECFINWKLSILGPNTGNQQCDCTPYPSVLQC
jgi:hypothetical protein